MSPIFSRIIQLLGLVTIQAVLLFVVLIITRIGFEDRTPRAELPGYAEYATHTRYRLFPGIW